MLKDNNIKSKIEVAKKLFKECKRIEKRSDITPVEKNSIKYIRTLVESTLLNPYQDNLLSNLIISMRGVLETKKVDKKNLTYFENTLKKFENEADEKKRDQKLESIKLLLNSENEQDKSKGFLELSRYIKKNWKDDLEMYAEEAVNNMGSASSDLSVTSGIFLLESCVYRKSIFKKYEKQLLELLSSSNSQIKGLVVLMCSRVKDLNVINDLIKYANNEEKINLSELEVPDYMIKFKHNGNFAYLNDMVRDTIFSIIDSTKEPSNYVTRSVSYSLSGTMREGEEFSIIFKIRPIVDMSTLRINLNGLMGAFDLIGQPIISLSNLKINDYQEMETRLIPEGSGHLRGTVLLEASDQWRGELQVDGMFERKFSKVEAAPPSVQSNNTTGETPKVEDKNLGSSRRENNVDMLIKDIQTMDVRKVVNALEELKNYVKGDENMENRLSALSVNFSLKGTEKITKVEMESVIEIAENIKHRL
ncbi:MAG: hypothetical protein ACYCSO_01645 [Cuniculiplasma sp.]